MSENEIRHTTSTQLIQIITFTWGRENGRLMGRKSENRTFRAEHYRRCGTQLAHSDVRTQLSESK